MIKPYIYHQEFEDNTYRLWLAGLDRVGIFKITEPVKVITSDPALWLVENQNIALDLLDTGHPAILKTNGNLKQLDRNEDIAWQEIRTERDDRLRLTDWTQTAPQYNEAQRDLWAMYRQALRDIPARFVSPYQIVWPDEPAQADLLRLKGKPVKRLIEKLRY